mmetsp:Transcript_7642/g.10489  ORF Transcript_7642/g.10489 Transcript_7642/m.10489 type:complete len:172 (+) Transcript_7642:43-558(+)
MVANTATVWLLVAVAAVVIPPAYPEGRRGTKARRRHSSDESEEATRAEKHHRHKRKSHRKHTHVDRIEYLGWGQDKTILPSGSWMRKNITQLPANRHGIKPGKWWDGVHRGIGFEERVVHRQEMATAEVYEKEARMQAVDYYDESDDDTKHTPFMSSSVRVPFTKRMINLF